MAAPIFWILNLILMHWQEIIREMSLVSPPGLLTSDLPDYTGFSLRCGWVNSGRVYMGVVWYVLILSAPTSENRGLGPGYEGQVVAVVTV